MNRQQIIEYYDSLPESGQDMPRGEFIKRAMDGSDLNKMMQEANAMVRGRIQKAQIDAALREQR